jgi:uncharacterized protein
MTAIVTALVLGVAGSVHCAAMCGPLMVALRQQAWGDPPRLAVGYHGARIAIYAFFGAIAGGLGSAVASGGFGRVLSIVAGGVLVLMAFSRLGWHVPGLGATAGRLVGRGLSVARRHRETHPMVGALIAGALNGLLPCGLAYAALTGAAGLASPGLGAASMAAFGLGTTPMLAAIWLSAGPLVVWPRTRLRAVAPIVLAIAGVLLITRGVSTPHVHSASQPPAATHGHHGS